MGRRRGRARGRHGECLLVWTILDDGRTPPASVTVFGKECMWWGCETQALWSSTFTHTWGAVNSTYPTAPFQTPNYLCCHLPRSLCSIRFKLKKTFFLNVSLLPVLLLLLNKATPSPTSEGSSLMCLALRHMNQSGFSISKSAKGFGNRSGNRWCDVTGAAHLLPPLLRRPLELSGLVVFGVEQVDVVRRVADQHLSAVLAVAQRSHAARLVGQVGGDEPHTHTCRPSAHVVPCAGAQGWSNHYVKPFSSA